MTELVTQLYHQHAGPLLRVAWGMLRDEYAAQDVVQEAFIKVWTHRGRWDFSDPRRTAGLLATVVRNLCRRRLRQPTDTALGEEVFVDPMPEIEEAWRNGAIGAALGQLAPLDRELLALAYACELSAPKIAKLMDMTPAGVRQRLSRARRTLKDLMGEDL